MNFFIETGIIWFCFLTLLFLSKQLVLRPMLSQHNNNNWLYIGHWWIANMLHQYYNIIGCRYEANANIANGNPMLSQCGLTSEHKLQYRQWETNIGPISSCCLGYFLPGPGLAKNFRFWLTHEELWSRHWKNNRKFFTSWTFHLRRF